MALNMYAFALPWTPGTPVDFKTMEGKKIHYWRKHPNLHGWMERLYREKGGVADSFNCVNLQLTADDIDRLEEDIRSQNLPFTDGPFFGESQGDEEAVDLEFVAKARAAFAAGVTVFYTSWW